MSDESVIIDLPPDEPAVADVSMLAPDATHEVTMDHAESLWPKYSTYWEDLRYKRTPPSERLSITMTLEQMRRWVQQFEDYIHRRNEALEERFKDAWGMYAVTVETWPPGMTDAQVRKSDRDPITSRTVATCWTERAAHETKASILNGEHPDFDPLDFGRGRFYIRLDTVPILSEGQTPPWEQD